MHGFPSVVNVWIFHLRQVLLNEEEGIYERYAALFSLRNHGGEEAIRAIVASLSARSALLRHEVGLIESVASSGLKTILGNAANCCPNL